MSSQNTPPYTPVQKFHPKFAYQTPVSTSSSNHMTALHRNDSINDSILSTSSNLFDENSTIRTNSSNSYYDDASYYFPVSPVDLDFPKSGISLSSTSKQLLPELQEHSCALHNLISTKFVRYPLKNEELQKFVISNSTGFNLRLDKLIGTGSNSYVHSGFLTSLYDHNNQLNIAVKLPSSKNKVKFIEKETEFMLSLRKFQFDNNLTNDNFPFIEAYGLYYLNKTQFPLFRKTDELPCLLLSKMDLTLSDFIDNQNTPTSEKLAIGLDNWWKLAGTLFKALSILRSLNLVHCDLKSDNLMLNITSDGEPIFKIIDFSSSCNITNLKETPEMTLQFTPPELISDGTEALPTNKTDLFSCGLILLHAAIGKLPYSNYSYDQFYLISLVKQNKALEVLEREDLNKLTSNPAVLKLINMILIERCELDDAIDCYETVSHS